MKTKKKETYFQRSIKVMGNLIWSKKTLEFK